MVSFHDVQAGLRSLEINPQNPVIVHTSLKSFGEVRGGADTVLGALLSTFQSVAMPTFTYKTMITPEDGPDDNAMDYGSGKDLNRMAEFFFPEMPADPLMGVVAEKLRQRPNAKRSIHPILSFSAVNLDEAMNMQTYEEPLAPIREIAELNGWVLLLGVDHTSNTSIHYAELLAGRRQFVRWALTPGGVRECPGFPGCSDGFEQAAGFLSGLTRHTLIGEASIRALPLHPMLDSLVELISADPHVLLCNNLTCARCGAIRKLAI